MFLYIKVFLKAGLNPSNPRGQAKESVNHLNYFILNYLVMGCLVI